MFIVPRKGFRLGSLFYVFAFVALFGAVALTMHVHYDPERDGKNSN
jgi:hypothetical protein